MPQDKNKWTANSMISGAGSGLIASITTCPLDVVKTKLQAQRTVHGQLGYQGVLDIVKTILRHDGIRGMYRGLGPTILGYLPFWATNFAVYDGIKQHFGEPPLGGPVPLGRIYPEAQPNGYRLVMRGYPCALHILSAIIAGAISTTCTNPLWVIKTRVMTQSRREVMYKHTFDAALTIYHTEGIRAFYRGLTPSLFGITHVAIQLPLYEQLKVWAQGNSTAPLSNGDIVLCSAIAKMTASIATYPHEVVRARLQTLRLPIAEDLSSDGMIKIHTNRSLIYITRKIIQKEGWSGLYKGFYVNLFRTVPNSAVTLLSYELLMRHLSSTR